MTEQEQRAAWDRLLTDLEYRAERARQIQPTSMRTVAIAAITSAVALIGGAGGGTIWLLDTFGCLR